MKKRPQFDNRQVLRYLNNFYKVKLRSVVIPEDKLRETFSSPEEDKLVKQALSYQQSIFDSGVLNCLSQFSVPEFRMAYERLMYALYEDTEAVIYTRIFYNCSYAFEEFKLEPVGSLLGEGIAISLENNSSDPEAASLCSLWSNDCSSLFKESRLYVYTCLGLWALGLPSPTWTYKEKGKVYHGELSLTSQSFHCRFTDEQEQKTPELSAVSSI